MKIQGFPTSILPIFPYSIKKKHLKIKVWYVLSNVGKSVFEGWWSNIEIKLKFDDKRFGD